MGLLVLDRAPAADALLEEDLDLLCQCPHPAAEHDADGCRTCACGARCLEDLGAEDLEDVELEADVARVVAAVRADRALRKRLLEDRADAIAKDPTRSPRSNRPRLMKPKPPKAPAEPKAPRAGPTKPAPDRSKAIARTAAPLSQPEHSRAVWQDETQELLEAVGAL